MPNEIIVGRLKEDLAKFGTEATAFLGKHIVGRGEEAYLANKILMDLLRPHLLLICGKRGTGKSYFGGVIAEEIALLPEKHRNNLTVVMIDTMGIYWSMKLPNEEQVVLLDEWGLKPIGLKDRVKVYVPYQQKKDYEAAGIPVDYGISVPPHVFSADEWSIAFNLPPTNPLSIGLQKAINKVKRNKENFEINDIISAIKDDVSLDTHTKSSLESMLTVADSWGVFGEEGVKTDEVMKAGMINVFDVSRLRSTEAWSVRNLLVALISKDIYYKRVLARKQEELARVGEIKLKERFPMVWLIIDEAHNFVPSNFETVSTAPLLTIVKQGREPGISLVPMTQMPNKIHPEVVSQADMVISHRLTSKSDLEALHATMQTYMMEDVWKYIQTLPKWRGASIILDDNSERIFQMQTRPRLTWHAGESAIAVK
ncbi:MAG: ATP-binding protein [Candidatus Aenigmarchaeota archaeon]|nr:ATP-binding protein [Candidatus Aenigmarchaeota archaeon]